MPDSEMSQPTRPDIGRHQKPEISATEPEVEIAVERKVLAMRFQTATPTFSTMPDSEMSLPTRPDIGQHRKPEVSAMEPEVETGI